MTRQRNPADVFETYARLDRKERQCLLGAANFYARGTSFGEPLDLLHEALTRTADGRRKWAVGASFGAHMVLAMRSIADGDRKLHANAMSARAEFEELVEWAASSLDSHESAEDEYARQQEREALGLAAARARSHWQRTGDTEAQSVLDGMLADLDNKEIAERLELAGEAVRLAKRRVLRKLAELTRL